MSFIHENPWLLQDLIKIGQGRTLNPTENISPQQAQANMALKMLDQVQKDFSPVDPNKPAEISTQSSDEVQLKTSALESLGALVSFLSQSKITVNGKLPVYDHDPQDPAYQLYKLEGNAGFLERADRQTDKTGFWINPQLLSAYIVSLQAQNAQKPNQVLGTYLSSLIQDSNKLLGTQVNPTYKAPDQQPGKAQPGKQQPGQQSDQSSGQQEGQQRGKATPNQAAFISETVRRLPFNSEYIDTRRIKEFADKFAAVDNDPQVTQLAQSITQNIAEIDARITNPGAIIYLNETNLTVTGFKMLSKQPNGQTLLANALYNLIQVGGSLFQLFINQFAWDPRTLPGGEATQRALQQQTEAGGPIQTNLGDLLDLTKQLNADRIQQQQGSRR